MTNYPNTAKFTDDEAQMLANLFLEKFNKETLQGDRSMQGIYRVITQWISIPLWLICNQPEAANQMANEYLALAHEAIKELTEVINSNEETH